MELIHRTDGSVPTTNLLTDDFGNRLDLFDLFGNFAVINYVDAYADDGIFDRSTGTPQKDDIRMVTRVSLGYLIQLIFVTGTTTSLDTAYRIITSNGRHVRTEHNDELGDQMDTYHMLGLTWYVLTSREGETIAIEVDNL
jgi:hypothetical protein